MHWLLAELEVKEKPKCSSLVEVRLSDLVYLQRLGQGLVWVPEEQPERSAESTATIRVRERVLPGQGEALERKAAGWEEPNPAGRRVPEAATARGDAVESILRAD